MKTNKLLSKMFQLFETLAEKLPRPSVDDLPAYLRILGERGDRVVKLGDVTLQPKPYCTAEQVQQLALTAKEMGCGAFRLDILPGGVSVSMEWAPRQVQALALGGGGGVVGGGGFGVGGGGGLPG